ncbi:MAG: hypothetical protein IKM41_04250 [Tidjanibacter sp.]|nr:hypothetical protein [Tidjanibacter sp.]MBR3682966.1 hypothetical protein [Tidjanibacter sp.]MBR3853743.1 hypothetical protein [Tidjanibacter sp.]
MKKTIIQILLAVVVVAMAYLLYDSIMTPVRFDDTKIAREKAVIERISDIRSAQRGYKQVYGKYTGSFDTLINFVLTAEMEFERQLVSSDDSVGLAKLKKARKKNIEKFTVKAIDTVFGAKKLTPAQIEQLRYIPYSAQANGGEVKEFIMGAGMVEVGNVKVPVFEARAPYKAFLLDLNEQLLVNLIDEQKNVLYRYPGIKVGDLYQATNDAGNWE